MKMRELLIIIPVHKDRLSSLSRPFAALQPFLSRPSDVLQMSFNRSSCRPLVSFSRLSTYLQSSLCHLSAVLQSSPPPFILLSAVSGQCGPTSGQRSDKQKPSATVSGVPRGVWVRKGVLLTLALHSVFVVVVDDGLESNITIYLGVTAKESI